MTPKQQKAQANLLLIEAVGLLDQAARDATRMALDASRRDMSAAANLSSGLNVMHKRHAEFRNKVYSQNADKS